MHLYRSLIFFFFFFNDTATTEIYTLSLHDALPILFNAAGTNLVGAIYNGFEVNATPTTYQTTGVRAFCDDQTGVLKLDRKSTRLNSSHGYISYAVFCLKKKKYTKDNSISNTERKHA